MVVIAAYIRDASYDSFIGDYTHSLLLSLALCAAHHISSFSSYVYVRI